MSDMPEGYYTATSYIDPLTELVVYPTFDSEFFQQFHRRYGKPKGYRKHRAALIERDGMECHYCEREMIIPVGPRAKGKRLMTIDHIVLHSIGGSSKIGNLVLSCSRCNGEKNNSMTFCDCGICRNARHNFYQESKARNRVAV